MLYSPPYFPPLWGCRARFPSTAWLIDARAAGVVISAMKPIPKDTGSFYRIRTADGRIDLVADHPCETYIFELKVDKSAAIAMSRSEAKAYAEPYLAPEKPVWLVGLSFERETRRFLEGVYESLS